MNSCPVSARVATSDDEAFLRELFFEIRAPEFALADLSERQLHELLANQFEARKIHYARVFPDAVYWVLETDKSRVGYKVVTEDAEIHLIDIAVRPEHQNQGIGTEQMGLLLQDAAKKRKSVTLSVEIFNPARRLYERLGFAEYEDFGIYKRMRWMGVGAVSSS
jgi:ribosomal protein S18 acetylase RimI-like enzyme